MLVKLLVVYSVISIYFLKDIFSNHWLSRQSVFVFSFTAFFWWIVNYTDLFIGHQLNSSICVGVGVLYALYLLFLRQYDDNMSIMARRCYAGLGFVVWLFFLYQVVYVLIYQTFLLNETFFQGLIVTLIVIMGGIFYFLLPMSGSSLARWFSFEWLSLFVYLMIHCYLFFILDDYNRVPRFVFFYAIYFSIVLPLFLKMPLRFFRLYIRSFVFLLLFLMVWQACFLLFQWIHFPTLMTPFHWLFYGLMPFFIILFFNLFDRLIGWVDRQHPFSVVDLNALGYLIDALKRVTTWRQVQRLIDDHLIFRSTDYRLHLWGVQGSMHCNVITSDSPLLDHHIVLFLQYKEYIHIQDESRLLLNYSQSPFQSHVRMLINFMRQHRIVQLSLLQKSREMVGIFALSFPGSRSEILSHDALQFQLLGDALSHALSNSMSVSRLLTHQKMLERINMASSKFESFVNDQSYYTMIRETLKSIIPEIKFYVLLTYDHDSQFYKRSFLLTQSYDYHTMKIHSKIIDSVLDGNMNYKFGINHDNLPSELRVVMESVKATQALFIRLNEFSGSSIFVLFFDTPIDTLDYRISFCHMFLRQSDIFYQYQSDCNAYNKLQLFLKRVLDQLPTAILISSEAFKCTYMNLKMKARLGPDIRHCINKDIRTIPVLPCIIEAIEFVKASGTEFVEKFELLLNGRLELYVVSAFRIVQKSEVSIVVVLTNIQQSKELIDQMNQTNRLAMMSKIASGISHELSKPVAQLISGVSNIQNQWNDPNFQAFFLSDIIPQVDRINLLCQSLLRLSRSNTESLVEVFLPDLLDQVFRLIAGDLRHATQTFCIGELQRDWVVVDQVMTIQVLMNLMIFCLKSLAVASSRLSLDIKILDANFLIIVIRVKEYNSDGFKSDDNLKDQLELSIVNQIVMNQHGSFDIYCEEKMTSFHVALPVKRLGGPPHI